MTPEQPQQKPYTVSFEHLPVSVTVAPEQLRMIGQAGGVVTIQLKNGCRIDIGPMASPEEAENLVNRVIDAGDRAHDFRPTPTSKEEYLQATARNPWMFPYVGSEMGLPPADWIADAWDLPAVESCFLDGGMIRDYTKGLGLSCSKELLAVLAAALRTEQVVRLYEDIRSAQPEREAEFRDDFLTAFASHAHAIPAFGETSRRAPRHALNDEWNVFGPDNDSFPY